MKTTCHILSFLCLCLLFSCDTSTASTQEGKDVKTNNRGISKKEPLEALPFSYDLKEPSWEVELPTDLQEVSGLGYLEEGRIAMVQDEQGLIFIFDLEKKEIVSRHRFKKKGDFEGIEILGNVAYVLRSDGDVYEVVDFLNEPTSVDSYENALSTANDTEGLGYDPETRLLLISSKESDKLMGTKYKDKQVIVSWDPETKNLRPTPYLVIDLDDIKSFLKKNAKTDKEKKFAKKFDPDKSSSFRPSAISVHPISKYIYLLASNGNMLLVVDRQRNIVQAKHLPSKKFPQPEGMCFDPEGNLYISNEGGIGPGTLKKFEYLAN
ncbi:MAG: SdiA-regulated domain-containing protein [Bacteroidota bacterium]